VRPPSKDAVLGSSRRRRAAPAVHLPCAHPVDIRLERDRDDRLLRAPPGLQERREIAALTLAGDQQLDLPNPRLPRPGPIPVPMRSALGRDLAKLRAHLGRDLRAHQLPADQHNRLRTKSSRRPSRTPRHQQPSSCSDLRPSWCLFLVRLCGGADEHEHHGGRNHSGARYTTSTDMTDICRAGRAATGTRAPRPCLARRRASSRRPIYP
jgi:hypothetical protein